MKNYRVYNGLSVAPPSPLSFPPLQEVVACFKQKSGLSRRLLLVVTLSLCVSVLQANDPDSIRQVLVRQPSASLEHARLLLELGQAFAGSLERDSAIHYYRRALTLSRSLRSDDLELDCHVDLARTLLTQRLQLDSVAVHLEQGLALADMLPDKEYEKAVLLRVKGEFYRQKGDLETGYELMEQSGEILQQGLESGRLSPEERKRYLVRYILVLNGQGNNLKAQGRCEEGIRIQERIIELCKESGNLEQMAYATFNKGSCYFILGNYPLALEHFLKSVRVSPDPIVRQRLEPGVLLGAGAVFAEMGQLDSARVYYKKTLQLNSSTQRARTQIGTLENLGALEMKAERYDSAVYYFEQSIALARTGDRQGMLAASLTQISAAHLYRGDRETAFNFLQEADALTQQLGVPGDIAYTKATLAEYYQQTGKPGLAISNGEEAYKLGTEQQLPDIIRRATLTLSKAYEETGAPAKALDYFRQYVALKEQLRNEDKVREITQVKLQSQFEQEQERQRLEQEKKDAVVAEQLQRQQLQRNALGGGLLGMVLIAGLLFWGYRTKQRSNALLAEKNDIIERSLQEKEVLLREIHHRVKNNLQVISSLLSLQSRRVQDVTVQEAILEGRNRVRSMAMIHQNLYQTENLTTIDVRDYIRKLTQNLFDSYNIEPDRIGLDAEIEPLQLDVDVLIPLGLILNELITNCLKYAFPADRPGKIKVSLQQEAGQLKLKVMDDGVGMPEDFDPMRSTSMGYQLISSFVRKLKGVLELKKWEGTQVLLSIPQQKVG
jgi:two-component sensor histidine kinase